MKQIYKGKVLSSVTAINDTISSKIATYSSEKVDSLIDNTYTKEESNTLLAKKANTNDVYTKTESDEKYLTKHQDISMKADKSEIPTKVSDLDNDRGYITDVSGKANVGDSYTKSESDAKYVTDISGKADKTSVYTKSEIDSKFDGKANIATTLSGYGITDAKIENGTITLGSNTIKPITNVSGKANVGDSYLKSETYTKTEVINAIVSKVSELIANSDTDFDTLQEMSAWLSAHKNTAAEMNAEIEKKYEKPSGGIPKTDLSSSVQTSLSKADTALQSYTEKYTGTYSKPTNGIPKTDLASAVQTSLGKADSALQSETSLSLGTTTGTGNAVTSISVNGHTITQNKGATFLTSHQDISGKLNVNGSNATNTGTSAIVHSLDTANGDVTDNTEIITSNASGYSASDTKYYKRAASKLWNYIKIKANSIYAALSHTHTKAQITDFPTSLPANGGTATKATQDGSGNIITSTYVKKSGDTLTGPIIMKANQYTLETAQLDMKNSDIKGANAIWFEDHAEVGEGLKFPRSSGSNYDFMRLDDGKIKVASNVAGNTNTATESIVAYTSDIPTSLPANGGTATTATNLKVSNHDANNAAYYPIWANGKGDGTTARGIYTSTDLNYIPANGNFKSKQFTVGNGVSLQWNSATKSLDFIFA